MQKLKIQWHISIFNTIIIQMVYIDHRIKKTNIPGKGYGFIAREAIRAGEVLIKETPSITIQENEIYSDIFQLLYLILSDQQLKEQFKTLAPDSVDNISINQSNIMNELKKKVSTKNNTLYEFFANNYSAKEIMIYCAKYMCNAFEFQNKPVILFTGTMMNHSCLPNVIFGEKDNQMCFITVRDIKKGEEICGSYIDITLPTNKRKKHLKEQYGFDCCCERCSLQDDNMIKQLHKQAIEIEKEKKKEFGHSKSKYV